MLPKSKFSNKSMGNLLGNIKSNPDNVLGMASRNKDGYAAANAYQTGKLPLETIFEDSRGHKIDLIQVLGDPKLNQAIESALKIQGQ